VCFATTLSLCRTSNSPE
ncbi:hypothetical protein D039_0762B, partial [Vibrio parahaemolyticus EKP-028]